MGGVSVKTVVVRDVNGKIRHSHGHVNHRTDFTRHPRTHLHHVGFIGAENTDRTVFFVTAQTFGIGIMALQFTGFVVIAQDALHVFERDLLFRFGINREAAAFLHGLLQARRQDLLNLPDTWVVVDAIARVITGVCLGEIKGAVFFRIVKAVICCPLHQILAGHEVGALRIIGLQTTLVAGGKILISRDALSNPLMACTGFKVPHFFFINECHAKSFAGTDRFNNAA